MEKIIKKSPIVLFLLINLWTVSGLAFEQWWQCSSRKGGEWNFARTPSICLVDHMLTQDYVKNQYEPLIFDDAKNRKSERERYMTELNAFAGEVAEYYLRQRKPSADSAEISAFKKGLRTLMHQETFWSHYREISDDRVRYMRGDKGHGHGLMQVDDRSHQSALLKGKGADLIHNMLYGLDIFYSAWQKAPSKSCVNSPKDYKARTRSAWAAYNGGPGKICRWKNSSDKFAHHDEAFIQKYNARAWEKHITDKNLESVLDVRCLAEE